MNNIEIKEKVDIEYNMLIKTMGLSISKHLFDEHFTLLWANDNYYNLIGYEKEEYKMLFHNHPDLYMTDHPDAWKKIRDSIMDAIEYKRNGSEVIVRLPVKHGYKWVRITSMFTDQLLEDKRISYTVIREIEGLMQDELEQELTYENIPGFVAKFRIAPDGHFTLLDANKKFIEFTGIDRTDFSSFVPFSMVNEKSREKLNIYISLMRLGESVHFTIQSKNKKGADTWMQVNGECLKWENGDVYYLIVYIDVTDITEQRELQKKLELQSVEL